ncbi:MAG TPA: hypothetical protein VK459_03620, partial [Polyangiaceae bacterium]|nr:hypothetical protein [Polyangiaceae bacterium]
MGHGARRSSILGEMMSDLQASNGDLHGFHEGHGDAPASTPAARLKARPTKVFISHSEKDSESIEQLESHLSILRREGLVHHWHQRR